MSQDYSGQPSFGPRAKTHLVLSRIASKRGDSRSADKHIEQAWKSSDEASVGLALRYGNLALKNNDVAEARLAFQRAVALEPENVLALYKCGFILERIGDYSSADAMYRRAQELDPNDAKLAFRRGRCLAHENDVNQSTAQFHVAIRQNYRVKESYLAIYDLESSAPIWKRLETLRAGSSYHLDNAKWQRDHAVLASKMGQHEEAVERFHLAEKVEELPSEQKIIKAQSLHHLGQDAIADSLLKSQANSDTEFVQTVGPGAYFKKKGMWSEAIELFKRTLCETLEPANRATIEFEIAHAYDRQYLWQDAAHWMRESIASDGSVGYRHYRLGVVLERMGKLEDALGPYSYSVRLEPQRKHWWFRLGQVLAKTHSFDGAVEALHRSIDATECSHFDEAGDSTRDSNSNDPLPRQTAEKEKQYLQQLNQKRMLEAPTSHSTWREILQVARRNGDSKTQAEALEQIRVRTGKLNSDELLELGDLLVKDGKLESAVWLYSKSREVQFPDGLELKRYLADSAARRRSMFAEYQEALPLVETDIFFESNHGSSIGCHPLSIYREMVEDSRFENYRFIWAHTRQGRIPTEVLSNPRVVLVEMHSNLYLKHLATSKYLINNVSFAPYFVRRQDQKYLNTWHGTPMKSLGQSMKQGLLEYENLARNFVQATHVFSPNELTDWALFDDHRIARYSNAVRRIVGSPRLDRLVNEADSLRKEIRDRLGVKDDEKFVLYAPTWRGGVSEQHLDQQSLVDDLQAMAKASNCRVFYRAHRLSEKLVSGLMLPVSIVPVEIDTTDLLAAVDVLVTDYSSVAFDFLVTRKRIVYYVPDLEDYSRERGLYISPNELPGTVCRDRDELSSVILADDDYNLDDYEDAVSDYASFEDGAAAKRSIEFLFDNSAAVERVKPLVVFHASLIPNGIASALLALLHSLDPERVDIVLVLEASVMRQDSGRQSVLRRLPPYVDLAFRIGDITATPEEQWAIRRDSTHDVRSSEPLEMLQRRAWAREASRVIGDCVPTCAVEFDGYAKLWARLVSNMGNAGTRRLIWQHNQLVEEMQTKYPNLIEIFGLYSDFDAVVPVSDALMVVNSKQIGELGKESDTAYVPVRNLVSIERIERKSVEPLDDDLREWMREDCFNVLSIGRLSPEKNFRALIEAWAIVAREVPNARLTILGSGLMMAELQARIDQLGLQESVFLAGQRANPYVAMAASDLFVLPSTHEGQPVVIFEAMVLGVPVAAAYTPGTAELIHEGYGVIIPAEAAGMADALVRLINHPSLARGSFDFDSYINSALESFERVAGLRRGELSRVGGGQ